MFGQILFTTPLPHLHLFRFAALPEYIDPEDSEARLVELEQVLADYNLTCTAGDLDCIQFSVELPPHAPHGASCTVVFSFRSSYIHITYRNENA